MHLNSNSSANEASSPSPEFVIFSPPFDENNGGAIVLHKLCHTLNTLSFKASMIPHFHCIDVSPLDELNECFNAIAQMRNGLTRIEYRLNKNWITPIYTRPLIEIKERNDLIVIYPEIIFGNPLRAKNVTRWLLHEIGFHNRRRVFCEPNEVHFRFNELHRIIPMPWVQVADKMLTVRHVPWDHYYAAPPEQRRDGTAFLIRKGRSKRIIHDTQNSIQIDGLSHPQIGDIFRRVKTFVSYDTKTMYSHLAALAGADSVVVPDDGVDEYDWQPNPRQRTGLAYGFERLEWARSTKHLVRELLSVYDHETEVSVREFATFWRDRLNTVHCTSM